MCTVVVRWSPDHPVQLLALRDELTNRPFDDPGSWWPEQPTVVGGRDRQAGGSWCVTDTATGVSGLVLNRRRRPVAAPGAPSRGALPLLAVRYADTWPQHVDLRGMASFALVLVRPEGLTTYEFDGERLTSAVLPPGTSMVTAGLADQDKMDRQLPAFAAAPSVDRWREIVSGSRADDDPTSLLVRVEREGLTFATVIAQVLQVEPGRVALDYSRTPSDPATWAHRAWYS